jgi:hypothetical protein
MNESTIIDLSQAMSVRGNPLSGIVTSEAPVSAPKTDIDLVQLRSALLEIVQGLQTDMSTATRTALELQNKQLNELLQQYFTQSDARFNAITQQCLDLEVVVDSLIKLVLLGQDLNEDAALAHKNVVAKFLQRDLLAHEQVGQSNT